MLTPRGRTYSYLNLPDNERISNVVSGLEIAVGNQQNYILIYNFIASLKSYSKQTNIYRSFATVEKLWFNYLNDLR